MKRFIVILLAVIFIIPTTTIAPGALTHDEFNHVLSPYSTLGFTINTTEKMSLATLSRGAYPYYRLSAATGSYTNNDLIFEFKAANIAPSDRPYIKINYRTNSPAAKLDVSFIAPAGEKWMSNHPSIVSDEAWNSLIINYNDIDASSAPFPALGEKDITFKLKPFGSQTYTLANDAYFDINYIAFFETYDEAEEFSYNENFGVSSGYPYNVLTPEALYTTYSGSTSTDSVTFNMVSKDSSFVRFIAAPGTYSNNDLIVSFSHDAFDLLDYPYVNVCYRTDSPANVLDVTMTSANGENWLKTMPKLVTGGQNCKRYLFNTRY